MIQSNYTNQIFLIIVFFLSVACGSEKSESIKSKDSTKRATIENVEAGIRANIAAKTKAGNGYFNFENDSVELSLKLVRVHTEYLSVLGANKFFACVDLATESGDVYDVDFFMNGTADNMEVTSTDVHKLNGKPFYTWKQANDKTWFTVPVKNASNELLGVIEGTDAFTFTYELTLPTIDGSSEMWIPIAQSDAFQDIEITNIDTKISYEITKDDTYGNQIMYAKPSADNSNQKISITYDVIRKEKSAYTEQNTDTMLYLGATAFLPVNNRFYTIATTAIEERQANTTLMKARALYDYIIDNMRYAKEGKYGTGDANYACDSKSGNCTEFHSFFISLSRSVGIPARFAVGAAIPSERNEGGVNGYHCWAEFYAEGKWWPIDISEGNKYTPLATYYFGHHPANRIEFSRGRDIKPLPLPFTGPINFLAYPVLEVRGNITPVKTNFLFERKLIEI
ncbi:MAG: transglutaminase-like putative cysteine protease [Marivirga sp.]|jgi:transglutaminase-like putative cysteine protease